MNLSEAQHDMRQAYLGGAPGLLASGTAWLVAGVLALTQAPGTAVLALLIGGMFIHPAAVLICKAAGRSGRHQAGNPLGRLALESTVQLLLAIVVAFALSRLRAEWFFPAMLLIIGGRYLGFATLYGLRLYWACGAALAVAGLGVVLFTLPLPVGALAGAAIEVLFATLVFGAVRAGRSSR